MPLPLDIAGIARLMASIFNYLRSLEETDVRKLELMTPEQRRRHFDLVLRDREEWAGHAGWWHQKARELGDRLDGDDDDV